MDEKTASALAKRLAAYSATAGVALTVAPNAGAQIVYHDFDPDLTTSGYLLDFDQDQVSDLELDQSDSYRASTKPARLFIRVSEEGNTENGVLGYRAWRFANPDYGGASRLSTGEPIGPATSLQGFYRFAIVASRPFGHAFPPRYQFAGEEGFAGFRFVAADSRLHYGWLRLIAHPSAYYGILYAYAYEASPDTPIEAGALPPAILNGSVNRRYFFPEGGTLLYSFSLKNASGSALTLDLWLDVEQNGEPVLSQFLDSYTLADSATVTDTLAFQISAEFPPGIYRFLYKAIDSSSSNVLTLQPFSIIKASATSTEPVAPEALYFLTAPFPNPTTGQTELTLEVAEAQAVRVEVLDALGRRVALLHDGPMAAGAAHRLTFDGSALPVGVYVVRAVGATFADTRVVTLAR